MLGTGNLEKYLPGSFSPYIGVSTEMFLWGGDSWPTRYLPPLKGKTEKKKTEQNKN